LTVELAILKVPHPIQYQGSKRGLAPIILRYLPIKMGRLVEPFADAASAWFSVHVAFLLYMLTPLFFITPPQPHRAVQTGAASDAAEATRR